MKFNRWPVVLSALFALALMSCGGPKRKNLSQPVTRLQRCMSLPVNSMNITSSCRAVSAGRSVFTDCHPAVC